MAASYIWLDWVKKSGNDVFENEVCYYLAPSEKEGCNFENVSCFIYIMIFFLWYMFGYGRLPRLGTWTAQDLRSRSMSMTTRDSFIWLTWRSR